MYSEIYCLSNLLFSFSLSSSLLSLSLLPFSLSQPYNGAALNDAILPDLGAINLGPYGTGEEFSAAFDPTGLPHQ